MHKCAVLFWQIFLRVHVQCTNDEWSTFYQININTYILFYTKLTRIYICI